MASDEKKRPLENGDAAVAAGDLSDSNANPRDAADAERQPLTGNHKDAEAAADPHKEKLLAEDGTPAAGKKGGKKAVAGAGTLSRLTLRRQELEEHL